MRAHPALAIFGTVFLCGTVASAGRAQNRAPGMPFSITFPASRSGTPLDGRLLVFISTDTAGEPRFHVTDAPGTQQVFGLDVDGWKPGERRIVDASAFGYPLRSLSDLRPGTYRVQALLNRYETFRRSDGHVVKLPPDKWEGQQYARKPGNLYSTPRAVVLDPARANAVSLALDQEIPPVDDFAKQETKYVKYVKIRSERLSRFWGRDTHLAAWVLLPWAFDEHPDARYPLMVNHGHFPSSFGGWRETPPDPTSRPTSARASTCAATTASSRSTRGSSTRIGRERDFRVRCSSRSSTLRRSTTTRTPSTRRTTARTATPSSTS
ncbi:MAG: hypothetical protein WD825_08100 [Gemmatimonadaceae bacterium]